MMRPLLRLPGHAPQLQPDATEDETTEEQILPMRRTEELRVDGEATAEALPDRNSWRGVGWIFRDGGCIPIERLGDEIRSRVLAD
jgi:hypothetical protein